MTSTRKRVGQRLSGYSRIAVWGAGGLGKLALRSWLPTEKVVLVVDSNSGAHGKVLPTGQVVQPPEALDASRIEAVVICTSVHLEVRTALRQRGVDLPVHYIYELFLPVSGALTELEALGVDIAATKNQPWPLLVMTKPQVIVLVTFRLTNWASTRPLLAPLYWLLWLLHHIACLLTSIQLPPGTAIGPGLTFAHYGAIVFSRRAQIGSFFTIYHGCTVGTNDSGEAPHIGDFVFQYAGAHVLGRCNIGDRSRIGANAVAIDTVCAPETTLVGLPARPVESRHPVSPPVGRAQST